MLFTTFGDMLVLDSVIFPIADLLTGFGFLMVLWSRLHLVVDCPRMLRAILVLIVIVALPLRIVIILAAIGPSRDRHRTRWGVEVWQVMYRLEMLIPVLDICLACLYIFVFANRFRGTSRETKTSRTVLWLLVIGELLVIAGDAAIMGIWFSGFFLIRWAIGPFVYALKLLVEFLILNSLTRMGEQSRELRYIATFVADEESAAGQQRQHADTDMNQDANVIIEGKKTNDGVLDSNGNGILAIEVMPSASTTSPLERIASLEVLERRYLGRGKT